MLLIFVFDPLAIILVIAANLSFKERRGGRITAMAAPEVDFVEEEITPEPTPPPSAEPDDWVANKYGEESAMDPKKEVDLQWLIDKKNKET